MPEISRTLVQKLITEERVRLRGEAAKPGQRVQAGDRVEVDVALPPSLKAEPEPIELNVVYEDECMVVIDKPAGLVVHPAPGHASGTLVNGLLQRYPRLQGSQPLRPGLVHRLDKDTSGLMVVGLNAHSQENLATQIHTRRMRRAYQALVWGHPEPPNAVIDVPVGRDAVSRKKMTAGLDGVRSRQARTHYQVVRYLDDLTLVELTLETGRTHQIRVHMAYIGHPVVGDRTYSSRRLPGLDRQFLHARVLELESPCSGQSLRFESKLPKDLASMLTRLETAQQ